MKKSINTLPGIGCLALRLAACLPLLAAWTASAQINIGGLADKTGYYDQVTFTITNLAGYVYDARLDHAPVAVGVPVTVTQYGYQELEVFATNTTSMAVSSKLVRFIVISSERAGAEDGLPPWTPALPIPSAAAEFSGGSIRLLAPASFPASMPVPVVAWIENGSGKRMPVNGSLASQGQDAIAIKRGVGSGFLAVTNPGTYAFQCAIGGLTGAKEIEVETNTTWTPVSGSLPANTTWPANARIQVTGHLTNAAGSTLTIGAGSVVRVNAGVDIYNNGSVNIQGTAAEPVVFLPTVANQPWGGVIQHANNASFSATGAIFTGAGANQGCWFTGHGCSSSLSGISSHRGEQALISLKGANCNLSLVDSAAISLAGQFGHSAGSVGGSYYIHMDRFLLQRSTTGGEYTDARFDVTDSAFIELPDDTRNFVDGDNDGLYIVNGTHGFTNVLFGWGKDDGVDSGGGGAGLLNFQNCWFESIFHEGNSLSGTGKIVNHVNDVFIGCGQGLESGYDGPVGTLNHCLAIGNLVGGRFGDNYNWTYSGSLRVTNSFLLYNLHDVWGMTWNDWLYRTNQMNVRSNWLSVPDPVWPENSVYDPAADGASLLAFSAAPAGMNVGVGFGTSGNSVSLAELEAGVPVRLSRFSVSPVSVSWSAEISSGVVASGVVTFLAGQVEQKIRCTVPEAQKGEVLSLRLASPVAAEITGIGQIFRVPPVPNSSPVALVPRGSTWRFLDSGANLGATQWTALTYPDTTWKSGPAQLGFGDGDEQTLVKSNAQVTTYFRRTFTVEDPAVYSNLTLGLLRDDGGVVYLNGTEVFRSNIRAGAIDYLTLATNALAADETSMFYTNVVPASTLVTGTNVLAVEIHQSSVTSSDLSFDLQLYGNFPPSAFRVEQVVLGQDLVLYWNDTRGRLQEAPTPAGPWTTLSTPNPWAVAPAQGQRYYRLAR